MAAPSIVSGATSGFDSANTTSDSVLLPGTSFADGQSVYIAIASDAVDSGDFGTVSRFSMLYPNMQVSQAIFNATAAVYRQANILKANETFSSPNYVFTVPINTSERQAWWAWAVDGDGGIGATGTDASGSSSTATIPAITTTANNSLVMGVVFCDQVATPLGNATGYVKMGEVSATSAATVAVYSQVVTTSGTTIGAENVTLNTSRAWRGIVWEIKAVAVGGIKYAPQLDGMGVFFRGISE